MFDQLVKTTPSPVLISQCTPSQTLIKYLIRLLIVIIECLLRFGGTDSRFLEANFRLLFITQTPVSLSFIIPNIIFFGICQFALS